MSQTGSSREPSAFISQTDTEDSSSTIEPSSLSPSVMSVFTPQVCYLPEEDEALFEVRQALYGLDCIAFKDQLMLRFLNNAVFHSLHSQSFCLTDCRTLQTNANTSEELVSYLNYNVTCLPLFSSSVERVEKALSPSNGSRPDLSHFMRASLREYASTYNDSNLLAIASAIRFGAASVLAFQMPISYLSTLPREDHERGNEGSSTDWSLTAIAAVVIPIALLIIVSAMCFYFTREPSSMPYSSLPKEEEVDGEQEEGGELDEELRK